jgi:hypothetical protein
MTPDDVEFLSKALDTIRRYQPNKPWTVTFTTGGNVQFRLTIHGIDLRFECQAVRMAEAFLGSTESDTKVVMEYQWKWWMVRAGNITTGTTDKSCRTVLRDAFGQITQVLSSQVRELQEQVEMMPDEEVV